ncbi:MAG: hypothetical protein V1790_05905 [Planctomycetota bacterium]
MRSKRFALKVAACLVMVMPLRAARAGAADVEAVLRLMPADSPVSVVVVDFEKLDKTLAAVVKSIKSDAEPPHILADIKESLGIADWIDFSKPVGMAQPSLDAGNQSILWAVVPGFAEKVKTVADAKEEDGVWHLTFESKSDVFAKVKGGYVIASESKAGLTLATAEGKSLADELKTRMDLFANRDALIHVNFDPVRPMVLGGIAQGAQMAPMFGMMLGQQGGADPMALTSALTGLFDGLKKFVEQINYIDLSVGVTETAGNLTIATGYKDGEIKSYLAKQKPASVAPMTEIEDQPYFVAMGCHFPGVDSPFMDYVFEKMMAASQSPAAGAPGAPGATPPAGANSPAATAGLNDAKEALQLSRDLYRKVEGWNSVIAMTASGMKASGDYLGGDTQGILDLSKKTMTKVNPLAKSFNGGASYEPLGSKKIGDASVDQFAVKFDTTNPAAAQAAQMMGENTRFSVGVAGGRVRYCVGSDEDAGRVFSGKVGKSLASNKVVAEAIATLPAKRNAVLLIDPAGLLPLIGPMMGMPKVEPMPPGPPVAISVSISGEPARVDINIPFKAIERVVRALSPQPPPT